MFRMTRLFLLLFSLAAFISCNDDDDNGRPNNSDDVFSENFGNEVSRDFIGQVVDLNNQPLKDVAVKIGETSVMTDKNGVFIVNGAEVHERFAYITAKKSGYLYGSRSMVPTSGKNNVKIMMIPAEITQVIQTGMASEVSVDSGTKVTFDGAFEDENGGNYSGSVKVLMYHLSPSNPNLNAIMPGMLYAQGEDGKEKVLETFGMINVELIGNAGQRLQIADGHTAEIAVAIVNEQLSSAPSSIPLWHFDEERGYWKQDGQATKEGNKYVGNVSHFSWWNCDAMFPTVSLCLKVVDTNGEAIPYITVEIVRANNSSGYGITDENGQVCGLIPYNETLTVKVVNSNCYEVISTSVIGPFSANATLPDIVVNNNSSITTITGTLVQCDDSNVTNGYVSMNYGGGYLFSAVTNGMFSFNVITCDVPTTLKFKGADYDNLQVTDSLSYTFTTPITNVGNLKACNSVNEFVSYKIDSNPTKFLISYTYAHINGNEIGLSASNDDQLGLSIFGNIITPGTYTTSAFTLEGSEIYIHSGMTNDVTFTLSNVGAIGEYIDMTFSGTFVDETGSHSINGVAHIKRR